MARRLVSTMVRMKGGPTLGGAPTRVTVYDDEALTVVSTLYQRAAGAGQQPNALPTSGGPHFTPNAGKQTTLRSDAGSGDTVLNVVSIASFAVGDMVPIFDGTNIRWRVITAVNGVGPTMTVDSALGVAFDSDNTFINRPSMRGHIWFWVDDVRDYFIQPYDVGAAEQMPPLQLPTRVPATALAVQEEGVSVGAARSTLNFIGPNVLAVDNAGALRTDITISGLNTDVQVFTASGTWTKPAGVPRWVEIICIGAGGGASGGYGNNSNDARAGGAGGGGGAYVRRVLPASELGATESVTVGAGGSGGAGGGPGAGSTVAGGVGGNSSLGSHVVAYGGGGGSAATQAQSSGGGGGGGHSSAGATGASGIGGTGGGPRPTGPYATVDTSAISGTGASPAGVSAGAVGGAAEHGGAGGGGGALGGGTPSNGGSSMWGGGGGGSGGNGTTGNAAVAGGAGGKGGQQTYTNGDGPAGGVGGTAGVGTAGASRTGTGKAGDGGGGGGNSTTGAGGAGGAGGIPGGGGGGGGASAASVVGASGAAGARGEVIVVTYF